ncbi:hypothetical protein ACOWPH_00035 [Anabaena sp. PCC 7938]|uniref:Uncharacterized protein n=1 Tax=Anabaena cylindrica (strain ATCC 27899 / PCC 7122) TaxID=272123 RepID=K9ZC19_ANACC|nr:MULTISPECIES: hypothetical protein [Anabaena]AFZ56758.1 hypothetical protein Anacy_1216 [Anabaena cylindrica PCC 7122]MBY5283923.1 hypothetical protein [Anabaena sp. CCAP 1446/1C]MBY5309744.1 hypothetical protein [Anabaena sp. CCAP 1446/1C]MCM2409816.1 hypothetical protein [Anabaena sp. CCAP 1446/1C]BAY06318.1 hypothetical protein NIES19_56010 [Anabaena cylindrica PCC 7122]
MKIKLAAIIIITLSTFSINVQKASALELSPLLEQLGTKLIDKLFSPQPTPTNTPSYSQPPENNYPNNPNYSNPYPSSPIPNNTMPNNYPSTQSYPPAYSPTQYSPNPAPANPIPFIYNPIIIVPQSPPVFNNYSNSVQR